MLNIILTVFASIACALPNLVSLHHIFPHFDSALLTTKTIGYLGGGAFIVIWLYLGRHFFKQLLSAWLLFFMIGMVTGPYLEPPSDPLHHLEQIQRGCSGTGEDYAKINEGYWYYSIASVLMCDSTPKIEEPGSIIQRVKLVHSIFFAFLLGSVFITAKRVNLKTRWAFFAGFVALLFMGTNRFSFFSYYSFAPSAFSMMIYWLWSSAFIMKRGLRNSILGSLVFLCLFPILLVNHIQEAVFISYLCCLWLLFNLLHGMKTTVMEHSHYKTILEQTFRTGSFSNPYFVGTLLIILFYILPQWEYVIEFASNIGIKKFYRGEADLVNNWQNNSELIIMLFGFHIGGEVWSHRIQDTLGGVGILTGLLCIPLYWPGIIRTKTEEKLVIFGLAILPFIYYFTPLFHLLWAANVNAQEYYRLCYSSMFWLFIAYFLQCLEGRVVLGVHSLFSARKGG